MKKKELQQGFSFIEVVIVISLISMLLGFIILNLANIQHSSSLTSSISTLVSDIRSQQNKAMVGATEGRSSADAYGIYVSQNAYTLFHGLTYNAGDATNLVISLDPNIQITNITFPNSVIVFLPLSGEISGYNSGANTFTLQDSQAKIQKVVSLNRYGAITSIQ